MSNQNPFGARGRQFHPTLPKGEVVMTYGTYQEAQQAVDVLARADFPVDQISIVGSDLKSVERVTGKLTWGRVAAAGAATGAWLGMFFGLLLVIFSSTTSLGFVLAAIVIGAAFGLLFGLASFGVNRRRRDFTSVMQVIATSYSVIADHSLGNRARNVLESEGSAGTASVPHSSDPPFSGAPPAEGSFGGPNDGASGSTSGGSSSGTRSGATASDGDRGSSGSPRPRPRYGEYLPSPGDSDHDSGKDGSGHDDGNPRG